MILQMFRQANFEDKFALPTTSPIRKISTGSIEQSAERRSCRIVQIIVPRKQDPPVSTHAYTQNREVERGRERAREPSVSFHQKMRAEEHWLRSSGTRTQLGKAISAGGGESGNQNICALRDMTRNKEMSTITPAQVTPLLKNATTWLPFAAMSHEVGSGTSSAVGKHLVDGIDKSRVAKKLHNSLENGNSQHLHVDSLSRPRAQRRAQRQSLPIQAPC